jgi:crotonobetainyl-CoA:carnitine CoA-transferase CaiB-like acyl-CoA transferase
MPFNILNRITVVECATYVTGPYAAALLGELGARVIKIEVPPQGDPYRYFGSDPHFSFNFAHLNRNKESIVLDLKSAAGREICLELLKKADVFVENFRPGAAHRLGLGYESLRTWNRRLIGCSISAFGSTGPRADKPGFDTLGQAASGLLSLLTDSQAPKVMGAALSDYITGLSAGYGILGALLAREQTGEGCRVETSLLQATLSLIGESAAGYMRTGTVPNRAARAKDAHAFAFITKDKLPLAIHCSVPEKFWLGLLKVLNCMHLAEDPRFKTRDARRKNYEALEATLAPIIASRPRDEWVQRLEAEDVPVSPIYNIAEVLAQPQVRHLDLIEGVTHPQAGELKFVAGPVKYEGVTKKASTSPPLLGEHSVELLRGLGHDQPAIERLVADGVTLIPKTKDQQQCR